MFTKFSLLNPLSRPDWRWSRGSWLAKRYSMASSRLDDLPTRRVFLYLRYLVRCQNHRERAELRGEFADIIAAQKINRENGNLRLELECGLLAAQSNAEIAVIMPLAVPVIEAYAQVFFDVRSRLTASSWIRHSALGRNFTTETGEPDIGVIARHFAYFGGPHILAMVLPRLLDGSALSDQPLDLSTKSGRTTMRVRLAVQSMTLPSDKKTPREMVRVWPYLQPYLSPLPVGPLWNGVLVDKVSALPESMLRQAVARARVTHKPRVTERTHQRAETTVELQTLALAQGVA